MVVLVLCGCLAIVVVVVVVEWKRNESKDTHNVLLSFLTQELMEARDDHQQQQTKTATAITSSSYDNYSSTSVSSSLFCVGTSLIQMSGMST
jgi:hypothetical protein